MKRAILAFLAASSFGCFATETKTLDWLNLIPKTEPVELSLPDLTNQQKNYLQEVLTLSQYSTPESKARIKVVEASLKEDGIDAFMYLNMRSKYIQAKQRAAESVTDDFDGQRIKIPGFLIPLEFSEAMVATDFLLVPVAGACIHMPPPPANQIIRVSYPKGFQLRTVQYPVWVEGTIMSNLQSEDLYIVDGTSNVTTGYTLAATEVVDYKQF
ncbi:TPA: DUF3299 domain-containing protein [Vibrio parahaemolyticus]